MECGAVTKIYDTPFKFFFTELAFEWSQMYMILKSYRMYSINEKYDRNDM